MDSAESISGCQPRIDIAGGGPVGLAFAIWARTHLGEEAKIRVFDRRWIRVDRRIQWCEAQEGNHRRQQVVTLQSNVWSSLPGFVQKRLFKDGEWSEMWPLGADSPASIGRPRNIRLRCFEDCMLDLAQNCYKIDLVPESYGNSNNTGIADILAICDGPRSKTRESLPHFAKPIPLICNGDHLTEYVLGLEVTSDLQDEWTVPITLSQNRFLFNSLKGGYINMRMSKQEATEVIGLTDSGCVDCIQSNPCVMHRQGSAYFCRTHQAVFKPSVDPTSFLWPRVQDGLKLYGVSRDNLHSISAFKINMEYHPWCTAQIGQSTFAFLLGDSACSLHFWPGRGLNSGLKSALSLARCIASRRCNTPLRPADFARHEGFMHQLQHREKSRAWTTMLMPKGDGTPRGIDDRIREGLNCCASREEMIAAIWERMKYSSKRIASRMNPLPDDAWYRQRLYGLDTKSLGVLLESDAWITDSVGGEEVSVDLTFPPVPVRFEPVVM